MPPKEPFKLSKTTSSVGYALRTKTSRSNYGTNSHDRPKSRATSSVPHASTPLNPHITNSPENHMIGMHILLHPLGHGLSFTNTRLRVHRGDHEQPMHGILGPRSTTTGAIASTSQPLKGTVSQGHSNSILRTAASQRSRRRSTQQQYSTSSYAR